jgi:hypothetical protein
MCKNEMYIYNFRKLINILILIYKYLIYNKIFKLNYYFIFNMTNINFMWTNYMIHMFKLKVISKIMIYWKQILKYKFLNQMKV